MRTVGKASQGRSLGAQGKVSFSLQKFRPWVLALGKGEEHGRGKMGPQQKHPWEVGAGSRRGEGREGKEAKIGLPA